MFNISEAASENQAAEKQSMDTLSPLSEDILQRVLPFLSQYDAVRTCVLSKTWRYLWHTRPCIDFRESFFKGDKELFMSVLDNTLQRYHDQNLCLQQLNLEMSKVNSESTLLLEKWIPIFLFLETFKLLFISEQDEYFDLPLTFFKSESLKSLYLERCRINFTDNVPLKHLRTLFLKRVYIEEETLDLILSSCPLIENMSLLACTGFKTIKVNNPNGLRHFTINDFYSWRKKQENLNTIEVNVTSIETIRIKGCRFHHRNYFLPHLTRLILSRVPLSNLCFDFFSSQTSLEQLTLHSCYGSEELCLYLSGSVKHLSITRNEFKKASIDAPNISTFVYEGGILETSISFTTTSCEWKSNIILKSYEGFDKDASSWFRKLYELLKALNGSEISLECHGRKKVNTIETLPPVFFKLGPDISIYGSLFKPVVVEHLSLRGCYSYSFLLDFLNCLFGICRPRFMGQHLYSIQGEIDDQWESEDKKLNDFLLEFLLMKRELRQYFWPQDDLEEVSFEGFDENGQKRHPFKGIKVLFRLKWRELSLLA